MTPIEKLRHAARFSLSSEMDEPQSAEVDELLEVCDTCITAAREALPLYERRIARLKALLWELSELDDCQQEIATLRAMQTRLIAALADAESGPIGAIDMRDKLIAELREDGIWPNQ